MSFENLGLNEALTRAVADAGYGTAAQRKRPHYAGDGVDVEQRLKRTEAEVVHRDENRLRAHVGVEVQIDLCPWCRTGVPKKQAAA